MLVSRKKLQLKIIYCNCLLGNLNLYVPLRKPHMFKSGINWNIGIFELDGIFGSLVKATSAMTTIK